MRYRLRTLLIALSLGPPLLAMAWFGWNDWQRANRTECRPSLRNLDAAMRMNNEVSLRH